MKNFLVLSTLIVIAGSAIVMGDTYVGSTSTTPPQFDFECFKADGNLPEYTGGISIGILAHTRPTSQLLSRIYAIFLKEILHYRNVSIIRFNFTEHEEPDLDQLGLSLELTRYHYQYHSTYMINLDVWLPSTRHEDVAETIVEAGPSLSTGRFGWFIPKTTLPSRNSFAINHTLFLQPESEVYRYFILENYVMDKLSRNSSRKIYQSKQCVEKQCATLIAEYKEETGFIIEQIEEMQLHLNVIWLEDTFREDLEWLYKFHNNKNAKSFILLHWRPSDIIYNETAFIEVAMPHCQHFKSLLKANCSYEMTPILKFYAKSLSLYNPLVYSLRKFRINDDSLLDLYKALSQFRHTSNMDYVYNKIACNWLKNNPNIYSEWVKKGPTEIVIGGIFPISHITRGHHYLVDAVTRATNAINKSKSVLSNYVLVVQKNDDECKADIVMKAVIHYYNIPKIWGILGPACSETVEPIAGISKHMNMAVLSYSAEGSSFENREAYPYFFRTIGSNRQYEDVYIQLMKKLGWSRVAALTEDGQKYTEYISHMETEFKQNQLELIMNKKFPSDVSAAGMNKALVDLKKKHARIIIADIRNEMAILAMCEAFKLEMTAKDGFLWVLPSWLQKNFTSINQTGNTSCTPEELIEAFDGHFSIMHTPFGDPKVKMQENITINDWRREFFAGKTESSNYIGFVYDAVWVYALAADKLLQENPDAINNLRKTAVVKRFNEIMWQTDFQGLSGNIKFGLGGSRITDIDIMQWRTSQFHLIGKFKPNIRNNSHLIYPKGGNLTLNEKEILWLSGSNPGDGKFDCSVASLAKWLNQDCDTAAVILTWLICSIVITLVSIISFWFWKHRYDKKLKRSAKIMKNFGIDILSPSKSKVNTLDKWEIPKENVVVNRRLGEGAFGTVYGGEAQIGAEGWTAVAVKTLKVDASSEDRLDFLSEAEAMKRFDHKNIVKLLGVCLQSDPIYTIMEFMLYGDLKTYLLARRHLVNEKTQDDSDISAKRLTMYAMDVAKGLAYLAQQKYVHRDIACRNCLVNAQRVVKLGDFGMSRPTFGSDYYRFNRKGMLPVRWMAPEALALGYFTPASDIWSFGVVLFEIITFGSFPFQGKTNNEVVEYVKDGNTLKMPAGIKPQLEGLIKACWSLESKKRPTAKEVIDYISSYPRLLTPCLDFPSASVEIPEPGSAEFDLLLQAQGVPLHRTDAILDIVAQTSDSNLHFNDFIELANNSPPPTLPVDISRTNNSEESFSPTTPDGYSIMSPLLSHQAGRTSESSQTESSQQTPF